MKDTERIEYGIEMISEQIVELQNLVEQIVNKPNFQIQSPWLDLAQASEYSTISSAHLRRLVYTGKIRATRIDPSNKRSRLIFFKPDIDQFLSIGHNRRLSKAEKTELLNRMSGLYNYLGDRKN